MNGKESRNNSMKLPFCFGPKHLDEYDYYLRKYLPLSKSGFNVLPLPFVSDCLVAPPYDFDSPLKSSRIGKVPMVIGRLSSGFKWQNEVEPVICEGNQMEVIVQCVQWSHTRSIVCQMMKASTMD